MIEEWVWGGPEDAPGSGVTLYLLYGLVPAAEETDLLEELTHERGRVEWEAIDAEAACPDDEDSVEAEDAGQTDVEGVGRIGQIIGMLEHTLGAEVIADEPQSGSDES